MHAQDSTLGHQQMCIGLEEKRHQQAMLIPLTEVKVKINSAIQCLIVSLCVCMHTNYLYSTYALIFVM